MKWKLVASVKLTSDGKAQKAASKGSKELKPEDMPRHAGNKMEIK